MRVEFLSKFSRDIDRIGRRSTRDQVKASIENVEAAKTLSDIKSCKKMTGHKTAYRIRIGDYRIGFYFENNIVQMSRVVHRRDIYKVFP